MTAEWWTGPIGLGCVTEVKTVCAFHGILTDSSINEVQKCKSGFYAIISVFFWIGKKSIIKEGLHYAKKKKKSSQRLQKKKKKATTINKREANLQTTIYKSDYCEI